MGSTDYRDTKLHLAVRYSDVDDVREALKVDRLDPNQIGLYQWSPLHEACQNGDLDIVKLLLKYKGDPNKQDALKGSTAVHYAAQEGHSECLQLLLEAGGRYNFTNHDRESCLDIATGECQSILSKQHVRDLISMPPTEAKEKNLAVLIKPLKEAPPKRGDLEGATSGANTADSAQDAEDLPALIKKGGDKEKRPQQWKAWGSITQGNKKKETGMGHIQLSFEYNSKKSSLKIRVWQVSDLLLPPVETSMISTLYVKSYLAPDTERNSKRKTEEVRVDKLQGSQSTESPSQEGIQVILKPTTFKFSKPLEYKNITKEMVEDRMVCFEICITQKYSRKSYLIATLSLSLKSAVRKLVRESFDLKASISTQIPVNMKIYSANDLTVLSTQRNFSSNPNLRNPSLSHIKAEAGGRAASDSNLKRVIIGDENQGKVPGIVISLPEDDAETVDDPENIFIHKVSPPIASLSVSMSNLSRVSMPGELIPCDDELDEIKIQNPVRKKHVVQNLRKSKSTPDLSSDSEVSELENSLNKNQGFFSQQLAKYRRDKVSQLEKGKMRVKGKRDKSVRNELGEDDQIPYSDLLSSSNTSHQGAPPDKISGKLLDGNLNDLSQRMSNKESDNSHHTDRPVSSSSAQQREIMDEFSGRMSYDNVHSTKSNRKMESYEMDNIGVLPGRAVMRFEDDVTDPDSSDSGKLRTESLKSYTPKSVKKFSKLRSPKTSPRVKHKT